MEWVEESMSFEPKPGRRFGGSDSRYIVPDVVVHKMGNEYVVVLNEDGIPRLRVNSLYRSLLRNSGDEARAYVEHQPRDDQQVRGDPARPVRAEVLLPQRHRLGHGRDGVVRLGEEDDPGPPGQRGCLQAAERQGMPQ